MEIKQVPEDFIVTEMSGLKFLDAGRYTCYTLKKRDYTTLRACKIIGETIGKSLKDIGFAGSKDKRAVTTQVISVKHGPKVITGLKDISLEFLGYLDTPVSLGMLEGNKFEIVIRNLIEVGKLQSEKIINYFGSQRFSTHNVDIGKLLLHKNFESAARLINEHNDEAVALTVDGIRTLPRRLLLMYIHSVQSLIWNRVAAFVVEHSIPCENIPLVGFGTEVEGELFDVVERVMKEEGVTYRDFVIRQLPEISAEGGTRALYAPVSSFSSVTGDDELNLGKKKVILRFTLPKGAYATEVIRQLMPAEH